MGLLQKWLYGVDLEAEQARQNELDAALAEMNRQALERGRYDQAIYEEAERNRAKGAVDVDAQVDAAFREGLKEGFDSTTGAIKTTLAAPFKFTFAAIPWQLWLAGAVALFFYMGGGVWLAGSLPKFFPRR